MKTTIKDRIWAVAAIVQFGCIEQSVGVESEYELPTYPEASRIAPAGEGRPIEDRAGKSGLGEAACEHDVCDPGGPLEEGCSIDTCVTDICAADPYCCTIGWDEICVEEAKTVCGAPCDGPCEEDKCQVQAPLSKYCDSCTFNVCTQNPSCCEQMWDAMCVAAANMSCELQCDRGESAG